MSKQRTRTKIAVFEVRTRFLLDVQEKPAGEKGCHTQDQWEKESLYVAAAKCQHELFRPFFFALVLSPLSPPSTTHLFFPLFSPFPKTTTTRVCTFNFPSRFLLLSLSHFRHRPCPIKYRGSAERTHGRSRAKREKKYKRRVGSVLLVITTVFPGLVQKNRAVSSCPSLGSEVQFSFLFRVRATEPKPPCLHLLKWRGKLLCTVLWVAAQKNMELYH